MRRYILSALLSVSALDVACHPACAQSYSYCPAPQSSYRGVPLPGASSSTSAYYGPTYTAGYLNPLYQRNSSYAQAYAGFGFPAPAIPNYTSYGYNYSSMSAYYSPTSVSYPAPAHGPSYYYAAPAYYALSPTR